MFNLTDEEALEELEFNLLGRHALKLTLEEARLPQKTLHNFRARLMARDGGRLAFQETTDRIIVALGIRTGKQRLDSTHIMSNIAILTRYAQRSGYKKVLILDWDAHHGNGTQEIFWEDRDVLFLSVHQMPLYPGSGRIEETGRGRGKRVHHQHASPSGDFR